MRTTMFRGAGIRVAMVAAACATAVLAAPVSAFAATQTFTAFGVGKSAAQGNASQKCFAAGYLPAQCTLISDKPTGPGDEIWVAVVQGAN